MQMNMHQNIIIIILIKTCLISHQTASGSNDSMTKNDASGSLGTPRDIIGEKQKTITIPDRNKRSPDTDEEFKPFWAQRGKRSNSKDDNHKFLTIDTNDVLGKLNSIKIEKSLRDDTPFWGNRGRKRENARTWDSLQSEDQKELNLPAWPSRERRDDPTQLFVPAHGQAASSKLICVQRYSVNPKMNSDTNPPELDYDEYLMSTGIRNERNDETEPFWGNRGRRDDAQKTTLENGKRKEETAPFWGNRGRRDDEAPFWGNRGRREDNVPFWGNRGRRLDAENAPFWGNRGRRNDETPFWGNRGRRYEEAPFWGNRGRRDDETPFWGNRGRRYDEAPFWGNRGRRNGGASALGGERYGNRIAPFWDGGTGRANLPATPNDIAYLSDINHHPSSGITRNLRQDPLYVDEPSYVLLRNENRDRILRKINKSYIDSRGKKKVRDEFLEAARARRGILEELTREVTSDPFYIARGKKDYTNNAESKSDAYTFDVMHKIPSVKSVICSHFNLNRSNAAEVDNRLREIRQSSGSHNASDRERRVILKKLTAELYNDPYFVSRGKKENQDSDLIFQKLVEICSNFNVYPDLNI